MSRSSGSRFPFAALGLPDDSDDRLNVGSLEAPKVARIPANRFVSPADPDQVMHITTDADATDVQAYIDSLPC